VPLPPALQSLESSPIIAVSAALFVIEFFADKIPAFDLLWSALHTFVRVPVAAWLAYGATRQLSPGQQLLAALLGAAIALAAHGGKTALRAAITPSPEPVSNIALSLGEDVLAVSLTWLATRHPYAAATIVTVLLAVITILVRAVVKALRSLFRGAERELAGRPT
jgi:energy-converting hydrogenase Eha subunit E